MTDDAARAATPAAPEALREALIGCRSTIETALRATDLPIGLRSLFVATYAEAGTILALCIWITWATRH